MVSLTMSVNIRKIWAFTVNDFYHCYTAFYKTHYHQGSREVNTDFIFLMKMTFKKWYFLAVICME